MASAKGIEPDTTNANAESLATSSSKSMESESEISSTTNDRNLSERLHSAVDITLEKFINHIKFSKFKKTFKALYDNNPNGVKDTFDQWILQLKGNIKDDLEEIFEDYNLDMLLENCERINKDTHPQISWRPSGNPEEDLRDHLYPIKVRQKEILEAELRKLKEDNAKLENECAVNHAEILLLKKNNDELHGELDNILTPLCGPNMENLKVNIESMREILELAAVKDC